MSDDVEKLRARIAELERELATAADTAADFVLDTVGRLLNFPAWEVHEGSEDWAGDVAATAYHLLVDAVVLNDEEGTVATLPRLTELEARNSVLTGAVEARDAEIAGLREALGGLEKAASEVVQYGAQTGSQWTRMTSALIRARAALVWDYRHA